MLNLRTAVLFATSLFLAAAPLLLVPACETGNAAECVANADFGAARVCAAGRCAAAWTIACLPSTAVATTGPPRSSERVRFIRMPPEQAPKPAGAG